MSVIAVKEFTTAQEVRENWRRINAARRASYTMPAPAPKVEPAPVIKFELPAESELIRVALTREEAQTIFSLRAGKRPAVNATTADNKPIQLNPAEYSAVLQMRCGSVPAVPAPVIPYHLQNRMTRIIKAVADLYGIPVSMLRGGDRRARYARPRQIAAYLCCKLPDKSTNEIGRHLGDFDHSTVIHGRDKIEILRNQDRELNDELTWLEGHLAP